MLGRGQARGFGIQVRYGVVPCPMSKVEKGILKRESGGSEMKERQGNVRKEKTSPTIHKMRLRPYVILSGDSTGEASGMLFLTTLEAVRWATRMALAADFEGGREGT